MKLSDLFTRLKTELEAKGHAAGTEFHNFITDFEARLGREAAMADELRRAGYTVIEPGAAPAAPDGGGGPGPVDK